MRFRGNRLFSRRGAWLAAAVIAVLAGSVVLVTAMRASAETVDVTSWYLLVNRNSGKVLDDLSFATDDGAAVVQWARHGGDNQQWRFIDGGNGYYRLQNRSSGKILDDYNWSKTASTDIVQWTDRNGSNQQFQVARSSGGYVRLINRFSGMAVEVHGASKDDGAKVVQDWKSGGANQQWQLVPAGPVGTPATGSAAGTTSQPSSSTSPSSAASPSPSPASSASSRAAGGGSSTVRFMGSGTVLIGGSMNQDTANQAPFDLRYVYIHSKPAESSDWYSASRCQDSWSGWWGCWTGSTTAPGTQITYLDAQADHATYQGHSRPQKFWWTWYSLRDLGDAAGQGDGPGEVVAINRLDLLTRYLNDYRFLLQKIGTRHDGIDLEPDFWGFARSLGNLHQVPAQVKGANPKDCGSQENSAAGLAQCLIAMTRTYAPNVSVGLHLSCFDWESNVQKCIKDYADLGAKNGDMLVTDVSDRDAGWYALPAHGGSNHFWTDQKAAAALQFYKTMAESVGKPVVLWQIPVGNMAGNNTPGHFQDDKVDWFFGHMDQVAKAHVAALLFGAGWTEQTTIESDGGNVIRKTIAYHNSGGVALR